MVSDVTIQTAIDQQSATSLANANLAEDFTEFLTLLTTQLQNQDPLSPMDSTEFTNQLVMFTQAEQMINQNQKLDSLVALGVSEGLSQAQNYVGQDISYISSEFYFDGTPQTLRYSLPTTAEDATLRIYNEAGAQVYQEDVSGLSGAHDFSWNGQLTGGGVAADGTYEIVIDAVDAEGNTVDATTVVTGLVDGVESQNGSIFLIVGERAVSLGNVLSTQAANKGVEASNNMTAALEYIGLNVSYADDRVLLGSGGSATINYTLAEDADRAKIKIYNDAGELVHTDDAKKTAGANSYVWDAEGFAAGEYTFEIDAIAQSKDVIKESEVTYDGSGEIDIAYTLQESADDVVVNIYNSDGTLIRTDNSAKRSSGAQTYVWDGLDDSGNAAANDEYTIEITAYQEDDEAITYTSSASSTVTGVQVDNGVIFLEIGNTGRTIALSEVLTVSVPEDTDEGGA